MANKGYEVYKEAQVQDLDQAKLILMMYAGAINFLNKALDTSKNYTVEMGESISRAKNVILELMSSLDLNEGGEMGDILFRTYRSLFMKLNAAHMREDKEGIAEIRDSLSELEKAWKQVFMNNEYNEFREDRERLRLRYSAR